MTLPVRNRPVLGLPPDQYDPNYMAQLVKTLTLYIQEQNTPGALFGSTLNLSHLPTSSSGLRSGDIYNDTGTLKIVP